MSFFFVLAFGGFFRSGGGNLRGEIRGRRLVYGLSGVGVGGGFIW